jgi:hypothetical protein
MEIPLFQQRRRDFECDSRFMKLCDSQTSFQLK